jgi:hypothetical protein
VLYGNDFMEKKHVASDNKTQLGLHMVGRDSSVDIATERPGDRIPLRDEVSRTSPERPWDPPNFLYRVFLEGIRPGNCVDHPPPSRVEVKKNRAVTLLSLWAFVTSYRVDFTLAFRSAYACQIFMSFLNKFTLSQKISIKFPNIKFSR